MLSRPDPSLGDDFAVLLPRAGLWRAAAVPFDNAERVGPDRASGTFPLAGVYRLFQAPATRIERPQGPAAAASLLASASFPWAIPDLADRLAAAAADLARAGKVANLHFREDPDFWPLPGRRADPVTAEFVTLRGLSSRKEATTWPIRSDSGFPAGASTRSRSERGRARPT